MMEWYFFQPKLLIEPYGIEIKIEMMVMLKADVLLIEPYGIEMTVIYL